MGLGLHAVDAIGREHAYRPITGDVLFIGRQATYFTPSGLAAQLRSHGHAVAIKRFDRAGGLRLHSLSACVALRAAGERFGYPELAQLLRRRGVTDGDAYVVQMR